MTWLWIILRYLFPADPIRQCAQAMRHRAEQLIHVANDAATLAELLVNPALRLQLEFLILDAEDSLRLWIAMRGCQIAKIRPKVPRRRATPHLTRPKSRAQLLARIVAFVADCEAMEQRAQAHAAKLKQLRDADPFAAHGSPKILNGAALRAAAHHELVGSAESREPLILSSARSARPSKDERVLTALATSRAPPNSIAGANP